MDRQSLLDEIEEGLDARRMDPEPVEETFNIKQGRGHTARKTNVDPAALLDELSEDAKTRRRQIAGWVSGVKHALLEPKHSSAGEQDFVESAGDLIPGVQAETFGLGVAAATGETPWVADFPGDLVVAYFLQLDRGVRVLTESQVKNWGVSDDRITAGARSMLYHKSDHLDFESFEEFDDVHRLHAGDGYDAARYQVVADVFFGRVDSDFRFAIPSPEHFLCIFEADDKHVESLRRAAGAVYDRTDVPLTESIFELQTGTPVPVEE